MHKLFFFLLIVMLNSCEDPSKTFDLQGEDADIEYNENDIVMENMGN